MTTSLDCSTITKENLTHLILINQMSARTGCTHEQAKQFLIATDWRLEAAIHLFFDERTMPIPCCKFSELITPANTPATPPNFPETLLSLTKLSTSSSATENQSSNNTNSTLSSSPMNLMMDGTT